jgi:hypothetical protein
LLGDYDADGVDTVIDANGADAVKLTMMLIKLTEAGKASGL